MGCASLPRHSPLLLCMRRVHVPQALAAWPTCAVVMKPFQLCEMPTPLSLLMSTRRCSQTRQAGNRRMRLAPAQRHGSGTLGAKPMRMPYGTASLLLCPSPLHPSHSTGIQGGSPHRPWAARPAANHMRQITARSPTLTGQHTMAGGLHKCPPRPPHPPSPLSPSRSASPWGA